MSYEGLHGPHDETPPLHLKDGSERLPLLERLAAALHNMRAAELVEADAEEVEAVKDATGADTDELKLPKVAGPKRPDDELPPRVKEYRDEKRRTRNVLDAINRHGGRPR